MTLTARVLLVKLLTGRKLRFENVADVFLQ